jgi:hypothetical protein
MARHAAAFPVVVRVICACACSHSSSKSSYGTAQAGLGGPLMLLGRNISVADRRSNGDFVFVNSEAAPTILGDP